VIKSKNSGNAPNLLAIAEGLYQSLTLMRKTLTTYRVDVPLLLAEKDFSDRDTFITEFEAAIEALEGKTRSKAAIARKLGIPVKRLRDSLKYYGVSLQDYGGKDHSSVNRVFADDRKAFLAHAISELNSEGIKKPTVQDIARKTGKSVTTIFGWFYEGNMGPDILDRIDYDPLYREDSTSVEEGKKPQAAKIEREFLIGDMDEVPDDPEDKGNSPIDPDLGRSEEQSRVGELTEVQRATMIANLQNTAIVYAGAGAQVKGMGKDLSDQSPSAKALLDEHFELAFQIN